MGKRILTVSLSFLADLLRDGRQCRAVAVENGLPLTAEIDSVIAPDPHLSHGRDVVEVIVSDDSWPFTPGGSRYEQIPSPKLHVFAEPDPGMVIADLERAALAAFEPARADVLVAAVTRWLHDAGRAEGYRAALTAIACYDQGPEVTGSFDEPGAARVARKALEGG